MRYKFNTIILRQLLLWISIVMSLSMTLSQERFTLSVVPQVSTLDIYEDWQPLVDYLSESVGVEFELVLQDTVPLFEVEFMEARPDFLFLSPYHLVMAHQAQGYTPVLADASRQLKGILVVPTNSQFTKIEELHNKTIAFPAPNAFGASLYLRAYLNDVGVYIKANYVGTHANAYRHALLGEAAAGGGVYATLNKESEAFQAAVRVLYETPGVTPHPLTVHPRVPEQVREAVIRGLLELSQTEEGRQLLEAVQLKEPMQVTYEEHYQMLENYDLEDYVVPSN